MLTTEIVLGCTSVIVIASPDIVVVKLVVASDVVTIVVGTVIVDNETWVTVGPGIVVGTVVDSVIVNDTALVIIDVM